MKKLQTSGFTLIELMVAMSLFAIVMVISLGAILTIVNANRASQSLESVMNNLNFAVEAISRDIRTGSSYGASCNTSSDCPAINFLNSKGVWVDYELNKITHAIQKKTQPPGSESSWSDLQDVTGPDVQINNLQFFVSGDGTADGLQPRVLLIIQGSAGNVGKGYADFNIQTTLSQRAVDYH